MSDAEWISPADLAAEFGIPITSVYQWNSKGTGPRRRTSGAQMPAGHQRVRHRR
jgi:hypothetical protein